MKSNSKSNIKWIIFFALLCLIFALIWVIQGNVTKDKKIAQIKQDNKIIKEIDLNSVDEPYEFTVETTDGHSNTIRVEKDKIAVIDSDCPDKVCVNTGYISNGLVPIVCLPHKLTITIIDKESEIDAIA